MAGTAGTGKRQPARGAGMDARQAAGRRGDRGAGSSGWGAGERPTGLAAGGGAMALLVGARLFERGPALAGIGPGPSAARAAGAPGARLAAAGHPGPWPGRAGAGATAVGSRPGPVRRDW